MSEVMEMPPPVVEGPGTAKAAGSAGDARQFVTFRVADEVFAVPMAPVQEIIRLPELIRVPLAPPALKGLANLRGTVLPIVALRDAFGSEAAAHDDQTRVLVVNLGTPVGFIVDQVSSVITANADQIEDVDHIEATIDSQLLLGVVKKVGGHEMVMILDFQRLLDDQFAGIGARGGGGMAAATALAATAVGEGSPGAPGSAGDEMQLVSFIVAQQEYAIGIESVQEIVQVPPDIVRVPKTPGHVLGVMTLRTRLLPLVSLRSMFGLPVEPLTDQNRIVVISTGQGDDSARQSVGVVMDSVSEVLRVQRKQVDELGRILAQDNRLAEVSAICRLGDGKRLVSILSVQKMFDNQTFKQALEATATEAGAQAGEAADRAATLEDDAQMVVFRLADGEFGVPIESVQEIVRIPEQLAHVPRAPGFIEGVINLRGAVLPVVDFRRRLGLAGCERNERQRIMVFTIQGTRTGFIVDSVTEVLKIAHRHIEPAPKLSAEQSRLMGQVANLEQSKRMIMLMAVDHMLAAEELRAIGAAGAGG